MKWVKFATCVEYLIEDNKGQQPELNAIRKVPEKFWRRVLMVRWRRRERRERGGGLTLSYWSDQSPLVRFAFAFQCRLLCSLLNDSWVSVKIHDSLCGLGSCTFEDFKFGGHENTVESYSTKRDSSPTSPSFSLFLFLPWGASTPYPPLSSFPRPIPFVYQLPTHATK